MVSLFVVPILAVRELPSSRSCSGSRDGVPEAERSVVLALPPRGLVPFSFFADGAAICGWTSYPPCSSEEFQSGQRRDLWILGVHLTGLSSLAGAINFIVTIHNMRAPG